MWTRDPFGATPASLEWTPPREPAANVIVVLNERYKVTVTDADGEYEFTALPAGEYRVRIEPSSLPQLWTPASPEVHTVVLTPGARIADVDFSFNVNARAVRRTLSGSQTLPAPRSEAVQPKRPRRPKVQAPSPPPPSTRSSRGASSGASRR